MELIETSLFTKLVEAALSDEEYRALQLHLILQPHVGNIIPGSGGLRKMRWRWTSETRRHTGDLLLEDRRWPDLPALSIPEERPERPVPSRTPDPAQAGGGRLTTE
jgi:hypothetical protein